MKPGYSEKFLRKRKFLLVLPVLVLPFITLAFYALGGGKGSTGAQGVPDQSQGLNIRLPGTSRNEESMLDKMSFYQQAERDSARIHDQEKNDPYYRSPASSPLTSPVDSASEMERLTAGLASKYNQPVGASYTGLNTSPTIKNATADANEQRIMMKLAELNKAISQTAGETTPSTHPYSQRQLLSQGAGEDVDRLENMMQVMNSSGGQDSEMEQLNGTLERILDIQHPERINEKIKQASVEHRTQALPVNTIKETGTVSFIQPLESSGVSRDTGKRIKAAQNDFYPLEDNASLESRVQNSIEAVIDETQSLVTGATVRVRLLSDIYINGVLVPRNTLVFGTSSLNDERLSIKINSIRFRSSIYPVSLAVYDMDGMEGIFVPGAISRDVAKESTGQALQGIGLMSLNPSLPAQAAGAGIQAVKTLLTRKTKLIRVTVKAGYQILLKDASQTN